jgi:hypothetical protein
MTLPFHETLLRPGTDQHHHSDSELYQRDLRELGISGIGDLGDKRTFLCGIHDPVCPLEPDHRSGERGYPCAPFDFNGTGTIDLNDVVLLFKEMI